MVIDARQKFAKRVAMWMIASTLSYEDMDIRLACWDEEFNKMIVEESRKLRAA